MTKSFKELERIFKDPWFDSLDPESRVILLGEGDQISVSARDFVIRKGDMPNGFYGVIEGVLAASAVIEDGQQTIFGLLEPGDWFGEASSIDGLPRSNDIHALKSAQLLHIGPPVFECLMRSAAFARAMAVLQSARTRTMYSFFEDTALQTTRVRVARRLLKLAQGDAPTVPRSHRVVHVTHETLSMMLGLTRQTLSLELKALAAAGAISLSYGRIVIESEPILRTLSKSTGKRPGIEKGS